MNGFAVVVDGLGDDRQTQPGTRGAARGFGAVEPVEDVRQIRIGDPGALVSDVQLVVAELDVDRSAGRAPPHRVAQDVADGLLQTGRV